MEIKGVDIFLGQPVRLSVEQGKIVAREPIDGEENLPFLSPGFVDGQVNGYRGIDYSAPDIVPEDIGRLIRYMAESGTTAHVPTIITNSEERICRNLAIIAETVANSPLAAAAIPAIHVEGPFISAEDGPRGAHDKGYVRDPSTEELDAWIDASNGLLKFVTIAPERSGAMQFIRDAVSRGIVVSIGHTAASAENIRDAIEAGATLSTHLGNGSHAQLPRLRNYLWEQLASDALWAGMIADGYHLPDSVLKVFWKVKGSARIMLVSDVAFLGGYAPGRYTWGDIAVEVHPDGHLGLADTPYLAGAGHLLDTCIPHFAHVTGIPLAESISLATANPLALMGKTPEAAPLSVGSAADLTLFRTTGPGKKLCIERTFLAGESIYDSKENA